jgi:peptidoglycan/LPS O-acetylase OafA/YrhL
MHSGTTWRLGHRPALDGLRGVAVLYVVAFHVVGPWFPSGGVVGVSLFFALSGFLITSKLLEEQARDGSVRLGRFYRRRARRLLPALAVMLAVVGSLTVLTGENSPRDLVVVVFYSANWWQAAGHDLGSFFVHMWSLAAEEQFYLVWPFAFPLVGRSRHAVRWLGLLVVALVVGRVIAGSVGVGDALVYYTSGDALIAGCAVALWVHRRPVRGPLPAWVLPVLMSATLVACMLTVPVGASLAVATVLSTAVVVALATGAPGRLLEWRPLREVGLRSYGVYLWHLPITAAAWRLGPDAGLTAWEFVPLALALTAVVVEVSWRYVEQPFLSHKSGVDADARGGECSVVEGELLDLPVEWKVGREPVSDGQLVRVGVEVAALDNTVVERPVQIDRQSCGGLVVGPDDVVLGSGRQGADAEELGHA